MTKRAVAKGVDMIIICFKRFLASFISCNSKKFLAGQETLEFFSLRVNEL